MAKATAGKRAEETAAAEVAQGAQAARKGRAKVVEGTGSAAAVAE